MKKIFLISAVFFCFITIAYKAFFYLDQKQEKKALSQNSSHTRLSSVEINKIQEGDFILRRGFGYFSDYIAGSLNTGNIDITHAGIIVKKDDVFYVIHSLSSDVSDIDGVQIQPLTDFLQYSAPDKIIVTRVKNADRKIGERVALLAEDYLAKHIPFDHYGIFDDASELFCTELIWQILEKDMHHCSLPKEASARKKFFHSMSPMYSKDYFDIVINQYK